MADVPEGLATALDLLACPYCAGPLDLADGGVVGCFAGHRFDVARHGYLTLLGRLARTDTADDASMVSARENFLAAGGFAPIAAAVADAARGDGPVLEIGAGTGYYLAASIAADAERPGVAVDSSKYAARRAARAHPRIASVVADAWSTLPVRDAAFGAVLSIFAPRVPAELARVIEPGGILVVVTPEPDHLTELSGLGLLSVDAGKADKVAGLAGFELLSATALRVELELTRAAATALVSMGPAARHRSAAQIAAGVAALDEPLRVTASVTVSRLVAG